MKPFDSLKIGEALERFWAVVDRYCDEPKGRRAVNEWCEFLGVKPYSLTATVKWGEATEVHAAAFLEWQLEKPGRNDRNGTTSRRTNGTVAGYAGKIRMLNRKLHAAGLIPKNVFDEIKLPNFYHNQKFPTQVIPDEEIKVLLDSYDLSKWRERRDVAAVALFLGGGLRATEARKLLLSDVRRRNDVVFCVLKGTKSKVDQLQAIAPQFAKYVMAHHEERVSDGATPAHHLLVGNRLKQTQMSDSTIRHALRRRLKRLGLPHYGCHAFRKTAINKLFQLRQDFAEIKDFARHKSIVTTDVYRQEVKSVEQSLAQRIEFK
jgi:integrase